MNALSIEMRQSLACHTVVTWPHCVTFILASCFNFFLERCDFLFFLPELNKKESRQKRNIISDFPSSLFVALYTQKKKLLNELKKIRVNFSTKSNYIFPPKSNLFEMSCCNLVV